MQIHLPENVWAMALLTGSFSMLIIVLTFRLPAIVDAMTLLLGKRPVRHSDFGPILPPQTQDAAWRMKAIQNIRLIADGAGEAVVFTTEQSIIELVNGEMELLSGYSAGELIGSHLSLLMPPELAASHIEDTDLYLRRRSRQATLRIVGMRRVFPLVRADKSRIACEMSVTHITNGISGFYAVMKPVPPPIEQRFRPAAEIGRPYLRPPVARSGPEPNEADHADFRRGP